MGKKRREREGRREIRRESGEGREEGEWTRGRRECGEGRKEGRLGEGTRGREGRRGQRRRKRPANEAWKEKQESK